MEEGASEQFRADILEVKIRACIKCTSRVNLRGSKLKECAHSAYCERRCAKANSGGVRGRIRAPDGVQGRSTEGDPRSGHTSRNFYVCFCFIPDLICQS